LIQQIMGVKLPPDMRKEVAAMQDKVAVIVSKVYLGCSLRRELDPIIALRKSPFGCWQDRATPAFHHSSFSPN
jgi:hypothetical protein